MRNKAVKTLLPGLVTSGVLFACVSPAFSSDLYQGGMKDEPVMRSSSIWNGFYVGGHIGAGFGDESGGRVSAEGGDGGGGGGGAGDDNNGPNTQSGGFDASGRNGGQGGRVTGGDGGNGGFGGSVSGNDGDDGTNPIGGVHLGYNWQMDRLVYGFEADASVSESLDNYLASLRARVGLASGRALYYITGGVAFRGDGDSQTAGIAGDGGDGGNGGSNDDKFISPAATEFGGDGAQGELGSVTSASNSEGDDTGFVAGAGVEVKLSHNVSAGVEGLHYFFDGGKGDDDDLTVLRARLTLHLDREDEGSYKDGYTVKPNVSWRGFYAGLHAGVGFRDGQRIDSVKYEDGSDGINGDNAAPTDGAEQGRDEGGGGGQGGGGGAAAIVNFADNSSPLGGIHIGYNWQNGNKVFGFEADGSFADDDFADYLATVRLRLGHAFGDNLVYATAGVAFAGFDAGIGSASIVDAVGGNNGGDPADINTPGLGGNGAGDGGGVAVAKNGGDSDDIGFVIGAGFETKLTDSTSLGIEGLYYVFDDDKNGSIGQSSISSDDGGDAFSIRARLSFHLDRHEEPLK